MAIVTPTLDTANCVCNSVVTTDCNGNLVCRDLCDMVQECVETIRPCNCRFFGDLLDTPSTCIPNRLLGTDSSCGGVVLLNPCAVLASCGIQDEKVKTNAADPTHGYLVDKIVGCPNGSVTVSVVGTQLQICANATGFRLIDTLDGPGVRPTCTGGRCANITSKCDGTGWQADCAIDRIMLKLRLINATEQSVNAATTGFYVPNGDWQIKLATPGTAAFVQSAAFTNSNTGATTGANNVFRVPRTGYYKVGMRGNCKIADGVHTIRCQVENRNTIDVGGDILLDDRFEGPLFRFNGSWENSYANSSFAANLIAPYDDGNLVRGIAGFGFGQETIAFLTVNTFIVFVVKFNTVVSVNEANQAGPTIAIDGDSQANMTNGEGPGTEFYVIEELPNYYPVR